MMIIGLGGMAGVPTSFAKRNVFYKHRAAGFYPTATYVISDTLVELPLAMFEVCVMGTLVYWMVGLTTTGGVWHYFVFILVLYTLQVVLSTSASSFQLLSFNFNVILSTSTSFFQLQRLFFFNFNFVLPST